MLKSEDNCVEKLLPCPFCGCKKIEIRRMPSQWQHPEYAAQCGECLTINGTSLSEEAAKVDWNTRATPAIGADVKAVLDAKDAEIARLTEENDKYLKKGLSYCRHAGEVSEENVKLQALLEQAREGLDEYRKATDGVHLTLKYCHATGLYNRVIAALTAATGEK